MDSRASVLYTQSGNLSVARLDLAKNKTLPPLKKTRGTELLCLHFDSAAGKLGALVQNQASQKMELVSVDPEGQSLQYKRVLEYLSRYGIR